MVTLDEFYSRIQVFSDNTSSLGQRIKLLLDEVIQKLPNEKQFQMNGQIAFNPREDAETFWNTIGAQMGLKPQLRQRHVDGNCAYLFGETIDQSMFIITIIIDDLMQRSDDYIKGLIVHELAELSYAWKITEENRESLKKLKPKARQVKMNQITKQDEPTTSSEYAEHEVAVNQEGIRLGFAKEINALDAQT
jgi:hypothetical protein